MRMVLVPAGTFTMGSVHEPPEHEVYLDVYLIGKFEVTYAQVARWLEDRGNHKYPGALPGWRRVS